MTVVRSGSNEKYASNWSRAFGGPAKASGTAQKSSSQKAAKAASQKKKPVAAAKSAVKSAGKKPAKKGR